MEGTVSDLMEAVFGLAVLVGLKTIVISGFVFCLFGYLNWLFSIGLITIPTSLLVGLIVSLAQLAITILKTF